MSHFDKAILEVLQHEGVLSDDKDDAGGLTKYGISHKAYPNVDIANLTREQAIEIYRRDYWRSAWNEFPYPIAAKLLDIAVNCGSVTAIKLLQRALGIKDDGIMGRQTITAVLSDHDSDQLLQELIIEQLKYYRKVADARPANAKFLKGWIHRATWEPQESVV